MDKIAQAVRAILNSEGVFQALMNLGFNSWNNPENSKWCYSDMIEWIQIEYGDLAVFATLIGKYNQQVNNGGHHQYFDNGYGGGKSRTHFCGTADPDMPLHNRLVALTEQFGFKDHPVYAILSEFEVDMTPETEYEDAQCSDCDGTGSLDLDCECEGGGCSACNGEGYLDLECDTCTDGTVEVIIAQEGDIHNHTQLDQWDQRYYELDIAWVAQLEIFFREQLEIKDTEVPTEKSA